MKKAIKFDPNHEKAKAMLQAMNTLKQKEEIGLSLLYFMHMRLRRFNLILFLNLI